MQYTVDYNSREYERAIRNHNRAIRRKREVRRNIFLVVAGISLILVLSFLHKSIVTNASALSTKTYCKYYESIMIEEGDTLWAFADEFCDDLHYDNIFDYIEEVCFINHIESNETLVAGNYIILPYYLEVSTELASRY